MQNKERLVPRMRWASYMNTGTEAEPIWSRIGEGFTELAQTMGAVEYARHYVSEKTERRDVMGYAPKIAYSCDVFADNPVIAVIGRVTDGELIGRDAQVEIVSVNYYEEAQGGYAAFRRTWTIIPDTKGAGVEALVMTGVFAANGDAQSGVFTEARGFTAAPA